MANQPWSKVKPSLSFGLMKGRMAYAAMSWTEEDEMEEVLEEAAEPASASAAPLPAGVRRPRSPGPIGHRQAKSARVGDTWKQTIPFLSSMFFSFSINIFLKGYVLGILCIACRVP